jgi:hypothetical protein
MHVIVELELCRIKECRTKTKSDGAAYQDKIEIERVADHCCSSTDIPSRSLHDVIGRLRRRPAGYRLNCKPRGLCLEAPACTTSTSPTARFNDEMTDMACVSAVAVKQVTINKNAPTNSG